MYNRIFSQAYIDSGAALVDGWARCRHRLNTLLNPSFHRIGPMLILGRAQAAIVRRNVNRSDNSGQAFYSENVYNHEHFGYHLSNDPIERWRRNRHIADTVCMVWEHLLAKRYPKRPMRLFVENQFLEINDDPKYDGTEVLGSIEVEPTLHLWTMAPGDDDLMEAYGYSQQRPDVAFDQALGPVSFDEVAARRRAVVGQSSQ